MEKEIIYCPKCGKSYYQEKYSVSTAMYSPIVIKDGEIISEDPNYHTTYCTCCACGIDFSIRRHKGETEVFI